MTAWFKRQRPETAEATEQSEPGVEAPTIDLGLFVARLEVECRPACPECLKPARYMVQIHLLDHCDKDPAVVFICGQHIGVVTHWVEQAIQTHRRGSCATCGHEVTAPHDLIEDVVKL